MKEASMLDIIIKASDIRSKQFKKQISPNAAMENRNTGLHGSRAHRVGLEAYQSHSKGIG